MFVRSLAFVLAAVSSLPGESRAMEREQFDSLARQCAPSVHPNTLAAVIKTESSFRRFAININGDQQLPRQPSSEGEAIATAEYLAASGYNFDAGLGQINSANVAAFGMAWPEVFEPCANLGAAARVLTECFVRASNGEPDQQAALRKALSCYNTGNFTRGHRNGYVARVERSADLLPAVVVPALNPPDGSAPATAAGNQSAPVVEDVAPDAFGNGRMDAFNRASVRARMERELQQGDSASAFRLTAEPQIEGVPIRLAPSSTLD